MKRLLLVLVPVLGGGYAALCLTVYVLQSRLVYFPGPPPGTTPGAMGLHYREVPLTTSDGVAVHAWFLPAEYPVGAVLFSHGNAGNMAGRLHAARAFLEQGFSVLLYDYRGYGNSAGNPSEEGTYLDAEAAYDWLIAEEGYAPDDVVLYGESLGGAVSIELARRRSVAGVFVEGTFSSLPDVGARFYPWLPVRKLSKFRYESAAKVGALGVPLLVAHSPDDDVVPFEFGRALYDAAGEPKRMIETAGGHNDGGYLQRAEWRQAVAEFLQEAIRVGG
ncbi:MAG: alpha/beta hydrolase [Planctomycetota bacterium]